MEICPLFQYYKEDNYLEETENMEYANAGSRLLLLNPDVHVDREVDTNEGSGNGHTSSPSTSSGYIGK